MIKLSLNRPVTTIVIFTAIVFSGILFFKDLSLSLFPSIDYPELTVVTEFKGASPFEVEEYVTKKLEQACAGIDGVRKVYSISRQDLSVIRVVFNWGENIEYAYLSLREKLDSVRMRRDFPHEASRPIILKWNPAESPVMGIFVSSNQPLFELTETLKKGVRQRIAGIDGVAAVQFKGGRDKNVIVEFDGGKIDFYGISLRDIEQAIKTFNVEQRGGVISKAGFRYSLRIASPIVSIEDVKNIPVKKKGNLTVFLKDVAKVYFGNTDAKTITLFNGKEGVLLLVYKTASSNTLSVIEKVKSAMKTFNTDFPGLKFSVAFENSRFIKTAISNVIQTIVFGGILAFLVILFFIGDFKAPLIIAVSIPVSILFTFVIMRFFRVNLNIMSLSGLALGVGMLVDNSIVVIESIFNEREKGTKDAEYWGTKSVALAVLASTLTTISVFFPLLFVYGVAGRIFRDQSLTITASLFASYLVAVSLVPVLARIVFKEKREKDAFPYEFPGISFDFSDKKAILLFPYRFSVFVLKFIAFLVLRLFFLIGYVLGFLPYFFVKILSPFLKLFANAYNRVFSFYHNLLEKGLKNRAILYLVSFLILFLGILSGLFLKKEFFPKTEKDFISFTVELPRDASLKAAKEFAGGFDKFLKKYGNSAMALKNYVGIVSVLSVIGVDTSDLTSIYQESGENIINYNVKFKGKEDDLKSYILSFFKNKDSVNIIFKKSSDEFSMIFKGGETSIRFLAENRKHCIDFAGKIEKKLKEEKGIVSISDNFSDYSASGINLVFDRDKMLRYGVNPDTIAGMISSAVNGRIVSVLKKTGRDYGIRVILDKKERNNLNSVLSLPVFRNGKRYPLSLFVKKESIKIPGRLERERQMPVAKLIFNLDKEINREEFINKIMKKIDSISHAGIIVLPGDELIEMRKSLNSLFITLLLSFILVYLLLCAQFESFKIPFIVIFTFPMGLAGALSMLFLSGESLNVISAIGLVVLSGIVVNDAIVKVDCIHQKVLAGKDVYTSIMEASKERFRPIWMTTITTVIGLLPVFIIKGAGSDLLKPLAVVLTGGMMLATTLTLFLIPALYISFSGKK